jgi:hypothetical protein
MDGLKTPGSVRCSFLPCARTGHPVSLMNAQEVPMSTTLTQTRPTTLSGISPDLACVCLFSLLGLMFSAAVLSNVSSETISLMFAFVG